jgi:hypothetical protein
MMSKVSAGMSRFNSALGCTPSDGELDDAQDICQLRE